MSGTTSIDCTPSLRHAVRLSRLSSCASSHASSTCSTSSARPRRMTSTAADAESQVSAPPKSASATPLGNALSVTRRTNRWPSAMSTMQASPSVGVAQSATVCSTSSKPSEAESRAEVSARKRSFSCARRRSVMSRTTAVNTRRPPGRSSFEMDASAGNSDPSRRRPATSRRCPMRRADSAPRPKSSTKASCRGRNRSGRRALSDWPSTSAAVQRKISSAPRLK